jgi:hypothetical protein
VEAAAAAVGETRRTLAKWLANLHGRNKLKTETHTIRRREIKWEIPVKTEENERLR